VKRVGELTLQFSEPNNEDLLALIAKLDEYLYSLYPSEEVFVVNLDGPKVSDVVFVIAYLEDVTVGCGAYRPLDERTCELKRIFVDPSYRNKGIASRILSFLEQEAVHAGFTSLLLETGPMQPESIELYKKLGFVEIERFGEYVDCPSSICMGKKLS
jgi:putative acetyltransferase